MPKITLIINYFNVIVGECISGALYWKELFTLAAEIGFSRPFLVSAAPVPIDREDFKKILGKNSYALNIILPT